MEYITFFLKMFAGFFGGWWDLLSFDLQIFYVIGIVSTFIIICQSLLLVIGFGDVGGDGLDMDGGGLDGGGDVQVLSIKTLSAFFAGFGWTGVICLKNDYSLGIAMLISTVIGGLFMVVVLFLMKAMYGLRTSGNINYQNAIGSVGTVYMAVPPNQSGPGQIEITIQGRVRFVEAFTDSNEKLTTNTRVKVTGLISPMTLLVEPLHISKPEEKD
jgi:hypothetical protein